jgi:hypothetical protein
MVTSKMADISLPVLTNVTYLFQRGPEIFGSLLLILVILGFLLSLGYLIGYVTAISLRRLLLLASVQSRLIKSGATSASAWASIAGFIAEAAQWLTVTAVLSLSQSLFNQLTVFVDVFTFAWTLFIFLLLAIAGLLLGGVVYKLLKEGFVTLGLEEELKKFNVADSVGVVPVSSILASIGKWYVVILFVSTGMGYFPMPADFGLYKFMNALVDYVPHVIFGSIVLLVALIAANFLSNRIKYRNLPFSDILALGFEAVIIFFGIVLALPEFGIKDVSIIADSFKILMIGVAVGLAIAMGFGLKDSVSRMAEKLSK